MTIAGRTQVERAHPDCAAHGLPEGYAAHPPLRRHARPGEDDRAAELRLYTEARGWSEPQTKANSIVGRVYMERGQPVMVLVQWGSRRRRETHGGPQNVLLARTDGTRVVRPFRGLRKPTFEQRLAHGLALTG